MVAWDYRSLRINPPLLDLLGRFLRLLSKYPLQKKALDSRCSKGSYHLLKKAHLRTLHGKDHEIVLQYLHRILGLLLRCHRMFLPLPVPPHLPPGCWRYLYFDEGYCRCHHKALLLLYDTEFSWYRNSLHFGTEVQWKKCWNLSDSLPFSLQNHSRIDWWVKCLHSIHPLSHLKTFWSTFPLVDHHKILRPLDWWHFLEHICNRVLKAYNRRCTSAL